MIKLIASSGKYKSNFIFTDFFEKQILNIVLMIHHTEDNSFYKNLNNDILNDILNLRLEDMSEEKTEESLKEYFITLNWQINSKLRKYTSSPDGISLLLLIIKNDTIFMVQFGRLLAAISENNKFIEFGRSWEYFKVKNKKELNLLGYEEENIHVKIIKKNLTGKHRIMIISSEVANKIDFENLDISKAESYLKYLNNNTKFLYLVFDIIAHNELKKQDNNLRKRIKITLFIMIAILLFSTSYVYFGKNWLQKKQAELKEKNSEFIRNDLLQTLLEKQNQLQDVVDQIFNGKLEIKIFADNKLKLKKSWEIEFEKDIIQKPLFDIKAIYLANKKSITAINKITKKNIWEKHFNNDIKYFELIDANRMLVATNDTLFCIKRKEAKELWKKQQNYSLINSDKISSLFFAINKYNQLDSGVVISIKENTLSLLSNISGKEVAKYTFENKIKYISDYDNIFKCLYIITDNKLIKLTIHIGL